jgi:hypothetical protein
VLFRSEVQEGLQALLIENQAFLDEGFPGLAHHEDGYVEHSITEYISINIYKLSNFCAEY